MHRTRQRPYLSKVTTTSIIFLAWQYKNTLFLYTITFSTSFLRFGPAILSGHTYWFSSCLSYAKCLQKYSWDIPMKLGDKWCNVSKKGPTSTSFITQLQNTYLGTNKQSQQWILTTWQCSVLIIKAPPCGQIVNYISWFYHKVFFSKSCQHTKELSKEQSDFTKRPMGMNEAFAFV